MRFCYTAKVFRKMKEVRYTAQIFRKMKQVWYKLNNQFLCMSDIGLGEQNPPILFKKKIRLV